MIRSAVQVTGVPHESALRALALAAAEMLAADEADTVEDPGEIRNCIADLEKALARLRRDRIDAEILSFVQQHPGSTSNRIALAVAGDRQRVLARLPVLEARGLLHHVKRSQGRREWFGQKTSAVLPTARAKA